MSESSQNAVNDFVHNATQYLRANPGIADLLVAQQTMIINQLNSLIAAKPTEIYITQDGLEVQKLVATATAALRNELQLVKEAREKADANAGRLQDQLYSLQRERDALALRIENMRLAALERKSEPNIPDTENVVGDTRGEWVGSIS